MEIKKSIIYDEHLQYNETKNLPLYCRISIEKGLNNELLITRKFFKWGFYDDEIEDGFYYRSSALWGSFYTKRIKDEDYLNKSEEKLIGGFIDHCDKEIKRFKRNLQKEIKSVNASIKEFINASDSLQVYDRVRKIKKLIL